MRECCTYLGIILFVPLYASFSVFGVSDKIILLYGVALLESLSRKQNCGL